MSENISHPGIVESIDNNLVIVRITQYSACAGCHAKSACTAADRKDKSMTVEDSSGDFKVGDRVLIIGRSSMGMQAVVLAFVVPLILLVVSLAVGASYLSEGMNGLLALLVLAVYYLILYKFRDKLKKHFVFKLKKI